jgi:hypothetical protein
MCYTEHNNGEFIWFHKHAFTLFHNGNESFFLPLKQVTELCMKEEYSITYIYWVYEHRCIKECDVYSETQVVICDILAPSLYKSNFLWNV